MTFPNSTTNSESKSQGKGSSSNSQGKGGQVPFVKNLAHNNRMVRDKAVKSLTRWLSTRTELGYQDLLKLWRGLFFCVWHSDKPLVQQKLCRSLANLLNELPVTLCFSFYAAFFDIMKREWSCIDRHRLDKFYLLMRMYVSEAFHVLARHDFPQDLMDKHKEVTKEIFIKDSHTAVRKNNSDQTVDSVSKGVAYHVASVYLEELELVLGGQDREEVAGEETLFKLVLPMIEVVAEVEDDKLGDWISKEVFQNILKSTTIKYPKQEIGKALFMKGAEEKTEQSNRKMLYFLAKKFEYTLPPVQVVGAVVETAVVETAATAATREGATITEEGERAGEEATITKEGEEGAKTEKEEKEEKERKRVRWSEQKQIKHFHKKKRLSLQPTPSSSSSSSERPSRGSLKPRHSPFREISPDPTAFQEGLGAKLLRQLARFSRFTI